MSLNYVSESSIYTNLYCFIVEDAKSVISRKLES